MGREILNELRDNECWIRRTNKERKLDGENGKQKAMDNDDLAIGIDELDYVKYQLVYNWR